MLLLANKYRRALQIKGTLPLLRQTMASMGVATRSVFEDWLEKEKAYLAALMKEPAHETLQMEYYQKLVNLRDHDEYVFPLMHDPALMYRAENDSASYAVWRRPGCPRQGMENTQQQQRRCGG